MNAWRKLNLLNVTKQANNKDRNIRIQTVATKEKTLKELSRQRFWPSDGYFKSTTIWRKSTIPRISSFMRIKLF